MRDKFEIQPIPDPDQPAGDPTVDDGGEPTPLAQRPPPTSLRSGELSSEAKSLAMLAHLLGLFTGFVGPLVMWLTQKDKDPFVEQEAKESLHFTITVTAVSLVAIVFSLVTFGIGALIAVPLLLGVQIAVLVLTIMASISAYDGRAYRYPFTYRFL